MKKILLLICIQIQILYSSAQCDCVISAFFFTAPFGSTVINEQMAGVSITLDNVVSGRLYKVTSSIETDFVTIQVLREAALVTIAAGGQPLLFKAPDPGRYFVQTNSNSSCGVSYLRRLIRISHGDRQGAYQVFLSGSDDNREDKNSSAKETTEPKEAQNKNKPADIQSPVVKQVTDKGRNSIASNSSLKDLILVNAGLKNETKKSEGEAVSPLKPAEELNLNFQDIYLFKNLKTQKMLEVEDGAFNKGTKVQQYFPYASNGLTDGYNQQWLIIPAGIKNGQPVYHIINYGFLKYLDAQIPLTVQEGNDADNQLWVLKKIGQYWLIKSFLAEQYLELPIGVSGDGAAFSMAAYTGEANQQFTMIRYVGRTGPGSSFINEKLNISPAYADNKVLDAGGATNDVQLVINDQIASNIRQQWKFSMNSGYYELRPIAAVTRCAAVAGLSMDNAARVVSWDCVNNPNEKWIIIPVVREKGKFILFNRNSGKCLNVSGGNSTQNGTSIIQNIYSNLENCKWKIKMAR